MNEEYVLFRYTCMKGIMVSGDGKNLEGGKSFHGDMCKNLRSADSSQVVEGRE